MLEAFKRSPEGSALASIGLFLLALCIFKFVHTCAMFVYTQFVRGGANPRKFGEWAVVTGANSGIGESMARQFAKKSAWMGCFERRSRFVGIVYDRRGLRENLCVCCEGARRCFLGSASQLW